MTSFSVHPAAAMYPDMSEEEFDALKNDIAENGLKQPIVLYEGEILDGRHRMRAIEELAEFGTVIGPRFENYTGNDPFAYAFSMNLPRRHLSYSQRLCVAAYYREHMVDDSTTPGKTRDKIAAKFRIAGRHVDTATRLKAEAPHLFDNVFDGAISMWKAAEMMGWEKPRKASAEPSDNERLDEISKPVPDEEIIEFMRRAGVEWAEAFHPTHQDYIVQRINELAAIMSENL